MARPKSSINLSASKETDDIEEDSLNASISEQISEEIESNTNLSTEDSLADDSGGPGRTFDKLLISDKKRKLFDIDSGEEGDDGDGDGTAAATVAARRSTRFSDFEMTSDILETVLSGDNIAQHFKDDSEFNDQHRKSDVEMETHSESNKSKNSLNPKLDEKSVNDGAINATVDALKNESNSKSGTDGFYETSQIKKTVNESVHDVNSGIQDDVILINDHEISITSLKHLQSQPIEQNTASDISELLNEDNVVSMKGDSGSRNTEGSENVPKSKSEVGESSHHSKRENSESREELSESASQSNDNTPKAMSRNQSVSENSFIDEELSLIQGEESLLSKKSEMRKIINESIDKMPISPEELIKSTNSGPIENKEEVTALKELVEVRSSDQSIENENLGISGEIVDCDVKAVSDGAIVAKTQFDPIFEKELNINLAHIQSRIQELHDLTAGKPNLTVLNYPFESDSRRDSLKDLPQSGRESSSIITNCTEYKTFPEEYFKVSFSLIPIGQFIILIFSVFTDNRPASRHIGTG